MAAASTDAASDVVECLIASLRHASLVVRRESLRMMDVLLRKHEHIRTCVDDRIKVGGGLNSRGWFLASPQCCIKDI